MLSSVGFVLHRHRKVSLMPSCLCPGKKVDVQDQKKSRLGHNRTTSTFVENL